MKFSELTQGLVIETSARLVDQEEMIAFARDYDPQWFHTEPERAASSRWNGLIGSGWLTCGIAMRLVCDEILKGSESFGSPGLAYVKWPNAVRPGDRLRVFCEVIDARRSSSKQDLGIVRWRWLVKNQNDTPVLDLEATSFFQLTDDEASTN